MWVLIKKIYFAVLKLYHIISVYEINNLVMSWVLLYNLYKSLLYICFHDSILYDIHSRKIIHHNVAYIWICCIFCSECVASRDIWVKLSYITQFTSPLSVKKLSKRAFQAEYVPPQRDPTPLPNLPFCQRPIPFHHENFSIVYLSIW